MFPHAHPDQHFLSSSHYYLHDTWHTTKTAQQQNNATPASDVSTKQETQYWQPGLHHAGSSKPANIRYSGSADRSSSPSTTADAQLSETSGAAETAASRMPSLCAMWLKSLHLQSRLRSRPHAACGSEARRTTAAPKNALGSCATSTVQLVWLVTPLGRGDVAEAPSAEVILRSETFLLAIPFRTIANPGTRMQHPAARPLSSNLLRARSRCPQATPRRQPASELPCSRHFSRSETSSYLPNCAERFRTAPSPTSL